MGVRVLMALETEFGIALKWIYGDEWVLGGDTISATV
jgi:hypothetical protein